MGVTTVATRWHYVLLTGSLCEKYYLVAYTLTLTSCQREPGHTTLTLTIEEWLCQRQNSGYITSQTEPER